MLKMTPAFNCNIFARDKIRTAYHIRRMICRNYLNSECNIFSNITKLEMDLKQAAWIGDISILLADRYSDLNQFIKLKDWFDAISLMLIVPDLKPDTIARAHLLRPRYLMPPPINMNEVWDVIQRLIAMRASNTSPRVQRSTTAKESTIFHP